MSDDDDENGDVMPRVERLAGCNRAVLLILIFFLWPILLPLLLLAIPIAIFALFLGGIILAAGILLALLVYISPWRIVLQFAARRRQQQQQQRRRRHLHLHRPRQGLQHSEDAKSAVGKREAQGGTRASIEAKRIKLLLSDDDDDRDSFSSSDHPEDHEQAEQAPPAPPPPPPPPPPQEEKFCSDSSSPSRDFVVVAAPESKSSSPPPNVEISWDDDDDDD